MIRMLITATAALACTGIAFAGTNFTATLETPVAKVEKVAAAKALWLCSDDTCTAELDRKTVRVSTCKKVAKELGRLTAFSNDNEVLSSDDLERCNAVAKS